MSWRHFALGALLSGVGVFGGVFLAGADGCVNGQPVVPPTVVDVGDCILRIVSTDLLSGMGLPQAEVDAANRCLGSPSSENVAQVEKLWTSHRSAEAREHEAGYYDGR